MDVFKGNNDAYCLQIDRNESLGIQLICHETGTIVLYITVLKHVP